MSANSCSVSVSGALYSAYKAPLTETEQLLADIWQEVLGIDRIGITDNFFALGGDSIKGIQMASISTQLSDRRVLKQVLHLQLPPVLLKPACHLNSFDRVSAEREEIVCDPDSEQLLADIWQEVLGIDRIGITDNFFALGGDSIKGIQMASRLQQHGWKPPTAVPFL